MDEQTVSPVGVDGWAGQPDLWTGTEWLVDVGARALVELDDGRREPTTVAAVGPRTVELAWPRVLDAPDRHIAAVVLFGRPGPARIPVGWGGPLVDTGGQLVVVPPTPRVQRARSWSASGPG